MDYKALKTELTTDPLARGYANMSIQAAADSLNTANRPSTRKTVPAHEVLEATVASEWASLTADQKARYALFTGAGDVNVAGANTRAAFGAMFGAGTQTRANLLALVAGQLVSRATELELGQLTAGDIERARIGAW